MCFFDILNLNIVFCPQPVRAGDHELRAGGGVRRGRGAVAGRVARRRAHHARARPPAAGLRGEAARLLQEAREQGLRAGAGQVEVSGTVQIDTYAYA